MADLRIVFYVGADMREHPLFGDIDARADQMLAEVFGGSTRQESRGSWRGPNGMEFEDSIRFEVLTSNDGAIDAAANMAEVLRRLYRQNEVLYSIDAVFLKRSSGPKLERTPEGYLTRPKSPAEIQLESDALRESPSYQAPTLDPQAHCPECGQLLPGEL